MNVFDYSYPYIIYLTQRGCYNLRRLFYYAFKEYKV